MTELVFVDKNIYIHIVANVDATSPQGFHDGGSNQYTARPRDAVDLFMAIQTHLKRAQAASGYDSPSFDRSLSLPRKMNPTRPSIALQCQGPLLRWCAE